MWGCDWVGSGWRAWVCVGRVLRFASGLDSGPILLEEHREGCLPTISQGVQLALVADDVQRLNLVSLLLVHDEQDGMYKIVRFTRRIRPALGCTHWLQSA
jgi:hypothetical protein